MIEQLAYLRATALPAILFLAWLPVFLWLPRRHVMTLFPIAGAATLLVVAGPWVAVGLVGAIVLGYGLTEAVERVRRYRRSAFVAALVLVHLAYAGCFLLPRPDAFNLPHLLDADRAAVFIFFSGIALTFFRLVGYMCDRRRGAQRLTFRDYLAYMLFFPQFRHGPVERGHDFADKLRAARDCWTRAEMLQGLLRIALGIVTLAVTNLLTATAIQVIPNASPETIARLYTSPEELSLLSLVVLIHVPGLWLYGCESAFASIQLGVSRTFGVCGSENFRYPLLARDPREVWHRWNITLSQWLRDYAYIALGGNRRRKYLNVFLVFVYCGVLHGPHQMRTLAWGIWAGGTLAAFVWLRDCLAMRLERATGKVPPWLRTIGGIVARVLTFHWFCIGVTILRDPDHCGLRVLGRFAGLLFGWGT